MEKFKIMVSACLLGERVRFNGTDSSCESTILNHWLDERRIISFCPEVEGGLSVPRPPAEIINGDGKSVLNGSSRILNIKGKDVTKHFIDGAQKTLFTAQENGVKIAILKEGSPSCGMHYIYDGSFSGKTKLLKGVTSTLLEQNGISVFNEHEIQNASKHLNLLEETIKYRFVKPIA